MTIIFCKNNRIGKFQTFYGTKLCEINECFDKAGKISGLCKKHYRKLILQIKPRFYGTNLCTFKNCTLKVYSKTYCKKHYELNRRKGTPKYTYSPPMDHCLVAHCLNKGKIVRGYCTLHYFRERNGVPLEIPKGKGLCGERNPRWKGGISEYPNHSLMKKIRKEVLAEANYICHYCNGPADRVHHVDKSKDNHSKNNLKASCCKCNAKFAKPRISKFKRLYGHTVKELIDMKLFKNYYQIPVW